MLWRLNDGETRETIRLLGIDRRSAERFGFLGPHNNVRYEFHSHTQDQLIWPVSGVIMVEAEKRLYVLGPGIALWIPALTRHATSVRNGCSATLFMPKQRRARPEGCRMIGLTPLLRELLSTAVTQTGAGLASEARSIGTPRFRRALFILIDELRQNGRETLAWPSLPLPTSRPLVRAVEYLLAKLDSVSVAELARQAGMSERSLRRHFRAETGTSVSVYLGHARMVTAMQLLLEDLGKSVADVSISVGFNTPSAFACAFRRVTGMSPVQFRRSWGRGANRRKGERASRVR